MNKSATQKPAEDFTHVCALVRPLTCKLTLSVTACSFGGKTRIFKSIKPRCLGTCHMMILHAPRYISEEVGCKKEDVEDAAFTKEAKKGELIGSVNGERNMIGERETEEECAWDNG